MFSWGRERLSGVGKGREREKNQILRFDMKEDSHRGNFTNRESEYLSEFFADRNFIDHGAGLGKGFTNHCIKRARKRNEAAVGMQWNGKGTEKSFEARSKSQGAY